VVVTDNLSEGVSPRKQLGFLAPAKGFQAQQKGRKIFIDPRSYARYDVFADVVASIDAKGFGALVRDLHPLLQSAYHALGYPNRNVDTVAAQALQRLVAAPTVEGPVELTPGKGALYLFADEKLEKQGPVEKHLLRMGPRNTKLIQAKARGVRFAVNPDAHHASGYADLRYGIGAARKAWLTKEDVVNTLPVDRALALFRKRGS